MILNRLMNEVKLSRKIEEGGRRVTVDLASDVIIKLDKLRITNNGSIMTITDTLERIIRKSDNNIW